MESLISLIEKNLDGSCLVLDIGCGASSSLQHVKKTFYTVGLDYYEPYIKKSKIASIHNSYVLADARNLPFKSKAFDSAIVSEVIEHLNKKDALQLLRESERLIKKNLILTTPNGYLLCPPGPDDNPEEKHLSGWTVSELRGIGFQIYGLGGLRVLRKRINQILNSSNKNLFARLLLKILDLSNNMLSPLVYYFPSSAFTLFCFKNLQTKD